jgi:hypothetical protein
MIIEACMGKSDWNVILIRLIERKRKVENRSGLNALNTWFDPSNVGAIVSVMWTEDKLGGQGLLPG